MQKIKRAWFGATKVDDMQSWEGGGGRVGVIRGNTNDGGRLKTNMYGAKSNNKYYQDFL